MVLDVGSTGERREVSALQLHMLAARKNCSWKIRNLTKFNGREYERELIRINVDIGEAVCSVGGICR